VTGVDDGSAEDGADDELRARVDDAARRFGVEDRPGAEHEPGRQRRRQGANQIDRARHRHRHLERAHAAFGDGVDDRPELLRLLDADDGDDANASIAPSPRNVCS
jgi:hypothetical protein